MRGKFVGWAVIIADTGLILNRELLKYPNARHDFIEQFCNTGSL